MDPQTETNCVIAWGNELNIPIILISNKEGEWLPPDTFPTGLINSIIQNKKLRKRFSQVCFGSVFVAFNLLFSPSRVRAMQSSEAQAVVSQAILERPTREHQLREQASTDEARIEFFSKRRQNLLFAFRKDTRMWNWKGIDWSEQEVNDTYRYYRTHPTIEGEVIERGMRQSDPCAIPSSHLWKDGDNSELWKYDSAHRLEMTTHRLNWLIRYRENTVSRYIVSLETQRFDPKITFNDAEIRGFSTGGDGSLQAGRSSFSSMGGHIEKSVNKAISVAMKAVADEILTVRREADNIWLSPHDRDHQHHIRKTLLLKTKRLKKATKDLIQKSRREIKKAEIRNQASCPF